MAKWYERLFGDPKKLQPKVSRLRSVIAGSLYRASDLRGNSDIDSIRTQIDVMRALYRDSQVSTAISYYATDATTPNSSGDIIWATSNDPKDDKVAEIINENFKRWKVNEYARSHIVELLIQGNLYIPTTDIYKVAGVNQRRELIALDNNTIPAPDYDIIPSYIIPPEDIIHLWYQGEPQGYIYQSTDSEDLRTGNVATINYPESSVIHFSLGGLLGKYTINGHTEDGDITYDIQFAEPLFGPAVQPTQTLSLLEDALLLSSLTRAVRIVNVDCGNSTEDDEIRENLLKIKNAVEQQLALNTATGNVESFVNPQSPNNIIYVPKINGADAISITDFQIANTTEGENDLLEHYQDKKLSVLGVPKEAMNFSSAEGLGGAGAVMSQRSALYANRLAMVENAYINGWVDALNKYFTQRNMTGFVNKFTLHMNPIITNMDQILFDKRDAALGQAQTALDLLKSVGNFSADDTKKVLTEILTTAFPLMGASVNSWNIDMEAAGGEVDMGGGL
jgi:hypothetical protein